MKRWLLVLSLLVSVIAGAAPLPPEVRRVVVLGDSIIYGGQYVEFIETWLVTRQPERQLEVINVGLPSETVSGLSEEGHAGGKFPRPDPHERLERALAQTEPDYVIACYGMNCGIRPAMKIGLPLAEARAKAAELEKHIRRLAKPAGDPPPHIVARTFPGKRSEWNGFDRYDFEVAGKPALVVAPKQALPGKPRAGRGEFFGAFANADVAPWDENTGTVAERYKKPGGDITLVGKPGVSHHPHGLADPTPIVEFIVKHAAKNVER